MKQVLKDYSIHSVTLTHLILKTRDANWSSSSTLLSSLSTPGFGKEKHRRKKTNQPTNYGEQTSESLHPKSVTIMDGVRKF